MTGVQGAGGPQGGPGVTGVQGAAGPQGVSGVQGVPGITGVQGSQGPQGNTGVQGSQGNTGVQGAAGSQGNTGVQGRKASKAWPGRKAARVCKVSRGGRRDGCSRCGRVTGQHGRARRTRRGRRDGVKVRLDQGQYRRARARKEYRAARAWPGRRAIPGRKGSQGSQGPQGPTGLLGDTLASHIQLATGGWMRAGGATAGVLFGETGGAFGLWGRGDDATQFEVSAADGRAYFAERAVTMDKNGLVLAADTGFADKRSVRWVSGSRTVGYVRAKAPSDGSYITLESQGPTGGASYCEVIANGYTGQACAAVLKAAWSNAGSPPSEIVTYVDSSGRTRMDMRSTHIVAVGGFVCSQYDDQEALGDGVMYGQEGVAAGGSGKIWALGGYTGRFCDRDGLRVDSD